MKNGFLEDSDIARRESLDYFYVIKYDGPDCSMLKNPSGRRIEYVGDCCQVKTLDKAKRIGNIEAASIILHNMKVYYTFSGPEYVNIVKVDEKKYNDAVAEFMRNVAFMSEEVIKV